jgi:hypothetical protein
MMDEDLSTKKPVTKFYFKIKCSVTINGTISRAAQMRTDRKQSVCFLSSERVLTAKTGINKTIEVSVSMNGSQQLFQIPS